MLRRETGNPKMKTDEKNFSNLTIMFKFGTADGGFK